MYVVCCIVRIASRTRLISFFEKFQIDTARAFIKGALPEHGGGEGKGDGHVRLIKVPVSDQDWSGSLTPHKVCKNFDKKHGKPERETFESIYTRGIAKRLEAELPGLSLTASDVVGLQQLCGAVAFFAPKVLSSC